MSQEEKIARLLLEVDAVKVRVNPPFTWNTGLLTPIYCDNRLMISYPKERRLIVESLKDLITQHNLKFDVVAGTATAGIPWAAFLAAETQKPMVYVRAQPKDYGVIKQVEGFMNPGSRVLIVEDLISTGRSSLITKMACEKEYGAKAVAVLAIFNYEMQKAKDSFKEAGIPLIALSNFSALIRIATEEGYLKEKESESALLWSKDPEAWHSLNGGKEILTTKR